VPFTLSTMSICSIEDVAAHTAKPFWFQVYTLKDDDFMRRLVARAQGGGMLGAGDHGRSADAGPAPQGSEERAVGAAEADAGLVLADLATKWRWGLEMLGTRRRQFGNIVGHVKGVSDPPR
jgi:L-lactate dehydrogenase (cytochrome)